MFNTQTYEDEEITGALPVWGCPCATIGLPCNHCLAFANMILAERHETQGIARLNAFVTYHLARRRRAAVMAVLESYLPDSDMQRLVGVFCWTF